MKFDWGTVPAVASAAVALAALVLSGLALAASRRSAAASERSAKTAESALALAREVRWTVTSARADRYLLTNTGREAAYDVEMSTAFWLHTLQVSVIRGGDAFEFLAAPHIENPDLTLRVTWSDAPGAEPRKQWRHPLPYGESGQR